MFNQLKTKCIQKIWLLTGRSLLKRIFNQVRHGIYEPQDSYKASSNNFSPPTRTLEADVRHIDTFRGFLRLGEIRVGVSIGDNLVRPDLDLKIFNFFSLNQFFFRCQCPHRGRLWQKKNITIGVGASVSIGLWQKKINIKLEKNANKFSENFRIGVGDGVGVSIGAVEVRVNFD